MHVSRLSEPVFNLKDRTGRFVLIFTFAMQIYKHRKPQNKLGNRKVLLDGYPATSAINGGSVEAGWLHWQYGDASGAKGQESVRAMGKTLP